jgi:hypothetical protein
MSNLFFELDTEGVDAELSTMLDGCDCVKSPVRSLINANEVWAEFEHPELTGFVTPVRRTLGNSPMTEFDFGAGRTVRVKTEKYEKATPEQKREVEMLLRKSVGL